MQGQGMTAGALFPIRRDDHHIRNGGKGLPQGHQAGRLKTIVVR